MFFCVLGYQATRCYISIVQSLETMVPIQDGGTLVEGGGKLAGSTRKFSAGNREIFQSHDNRCAYDIV